MKEYMEMEVKVSNGRIVRSNVNDDGTCKLTVEIGEIKLRKPRSKSIPEALIEASKLSLEDLFMQYEPKTNKEQEFKELLTAVIKKGVKDFYRPSIDPSFNKDETGICYVKGRKPAVGKSYNWWYKAAKEYDTARRSRLGTKSEYIAFLGVLIKRLVERGWSIEDAWYAVCCDSKKLGHYYNSVRAKYSIETTGSREVCGFFDLGNTFKILAEYEEAGGFWLAGGGYVDDSDYYPLAVLYRNNGRYYNGKYSVGWLVLEEGSTDH